MFAAFVGCILLFAIWNELRKIHHTLEAMWEDLPGTLLDP